MIKELTSHIASVCSLTIGTNLFAGTGSTDTPDTAIIVEEIDPGSADTLLLDQRQQPFRILARATSYFAARNSAQSVWSALHGQWHIILPVIVSGELWEMSFDCATPAFIGRDERNRFQFAFRVLTKIQSVL